MSTAITHVQPGSIAQRLGLAAGDKLVSIASEPIIDQIDYQALTAQERFDMMVEDAGGQTRTVHVRKEDWEPLGLTRDQTIVSKPRPCRNHCIFCFIDQMPPGMRKTLYVKDDDWRLSLMMGNYITMTNIDDHELDRIIRRKVSPLFVSVQCTDPDMRVKLLRNPNAAKIMDNLRLLKANGIRFHAQMVLCPGWNDGEILKKSLEDLEALRRGVPNLLHHVRCIRDTFGLPCVVAINRFPTDTEAELKLIETKCKELGVNVALSEVWGKGGEGGVELAKEVIRLCEQPNDFTFSYELNCSIKEKIEAIAKKIYHADGVNFTANAEKQIKTLTELGYDHMPICMAKTQYSFTDDQTKLGAPRDFTITVRNVKVSAGAGFLVALTGEIMTMPGLPKVPAAERIDVDETGKISGLF